MDHSRDVRLQNLRQAARCGARTRSGIPCQRPALIIQRQVAALLSDFQIRPKTVRVPGLGTPKGYERSIFEDAFQRYLPPQRGRAWATLTPRHVQLRSAGKITVQILGCRHHLITTVRDSISDRADGRV
jgi:Protein of unknown function (DUF3631)